MHYKMSKLGFQLRALAVAINISTLDSRKCTAPGLCVRTRLSVKSIRLTLRLKFLFTQV